jgi:hypothetical protein
MILYRLRQVSKLPRPIDFVAGDAMPAQGRWTTRLGFERARRISEIALETEPEWRLYEWLLANNVVPKLILAPPEVTSADNPKGRAWFHLPSGKSVRFDGSNRFLCRVISGTDRYLSLDDIMSREQV